jgi:predicted nucleic acid-binding protein
MILVDVNLLVYAWDRGSPSHETAVQWLDGKLSGSARVGLAWECLLGFMRVV